MLQASTAGVSQQVNVLIIEFMDPPPQMTVLFREPRYASSLQRRLFAVRDYIAGPARGQSHGRLVTIPLSPGVTIPGRTCAIREGRNGSCVYVPAPGTKYGKVGRLVGGVAGAGGFERVDAAYQQLCNNFERSTVIHLKMLLSRLKRTRRVSHGALSSRPERRRPSLAMLQWTRRSFVDRRIPLMALTSSARARPGAMTTG